MSSIIQSCLMALSCQWFSSASDRAVKAKKIIIPDPVVRNNAAVQVQVVQDRLNGKLLINVSSG